MTWFMEPKLSLHTVLFAIVFADAMEAGDWNKAAIVFAVGVTTAWLWQCLLAVRSAPNNGEGE